MMRHRSVRVVGEQRSNRASPKPSTPKRTKTRHHDGPEGDCATGSEDHAKWLEDYKDALETEDDGMGSDLP